MSAERCGESLKFIFVENLDLPVLIVSPRAHIMVQKIRNVYPNWEAKNEKDVWRKAYSMGLIEGEEE